MKHPVDTSTWGEFVVGELFDVHPTKAYKLKNSDLLSTNGKNPVVVNSSYNNGIGGYTDQELTEAGNILTFSDTTSGADTLFFQEKPFVGYPHVQGMYPKTFELTINVAKFMIASLRASINKYSWDYTNKLTRTFISSTTIKLPLKSSADPENYTQDNIDWDYMEMVMSRVTARAKERLANLPQPTDKKKTPVDTSSWGEFDIIALFDIINTKSIRQSDVQDQLQSNNGSTPYITASDKNNAILSYIDCPQEWIDEGNCIFIGGKTTTVTYQQHDFCSNDSHNLALYLKNEQARTKYIQLYLASILKKAFAKYHWGDALSKAKIKAETIKLPLKPVANLENYTQGDIDWNFMVNFMQTIEEKAHARLVELNEQMMNEDD